MIFIINKYKQTQRYIQNAQPASLSPQKVRQGLQSLQSLQHHSRSNQKVSAYGLQKMLQRAGQPYWFPQISLNTGLSLLGGGAKNMITHRRRASEASTHPFLDFPSERSVRVRVTPEGIQSASTLY